MDANSSSLMGVVAGADEKPIQVYPGAFDEDLGAKYRCGGTLKGWRKIPKLAAGNSRFMLALALAFVGPIGDVLRVEQVAIQLLGARAWLALAQNESDSALSLMREAVQREDATEKSAITPGPLAPARELLADMLMRLQRPSEAIVEYRKTLEKEPNRRRSMRGINAVKR